MNKKSYFDEKESIFYPNGLKGIAEYCRKEWEKDTKHIIRCGENACENKFIFDFPWDMERTWEIYRFGKKIDWNMIPFGDREFLWQFNRHRFFLSMGQAYQLTGDEKFPKHFVRIFTSWVHEDLEGANIDLGPWRTLETGIRGGNWIRTLFLLKDSPCIDDTFLELFLKQLLKHGNRLVENFSPHKYQSNWGVLESEGLLLIGIALPDCSEKREFISTAITRLSLAARLQVMGDGVHWEQSPMYHNEVYRSFLIASYYGEKANIVLPPEIKETARKMAFANLAWKKPDHTQFAQGDSDATDLRDQLTAGAWFFKDSFLKFGGYQKLDFESAWLFGEKACREYLEIPCTEPDYTSIALAESGNYYFRSGWEENANLLHFRCGDMGAGHGHADKLHIDLVLNGEDVLVDSGRYTYVENKERYYLKGVQGHNTVIADATEFTEITDSWFCSKLSTAVKQQFKDMKIAGFVEGGHLGYLEKGIYTSRRVLWIKPDIYLISDIFFTNQEHQYKALYHFSGHGKVEKKNRCIVFSGKKSEAFLQFPDQNISLELEDSIQSSFYNQKNKNITLKAEKCSKGFYSMITVINGGKKGEVNPVFIKKIEASSVVHGRKFTNQEAEAYLIQAEEREYVVFIANQEIFSPADTAIIGKCMGYGKVIVFETAGKEEAIITGEILSS